MRSWISLFGSKHRDVAGASASNKRVPPALTAFAPENTARVASRVGTLERYGAPCKVGAFLQVEVLPRQLGGSAS